MNIYNKAADIVQGWADWLNKCQPRIRENDEKIGKAILKAGEAVARFGESIKPFK